MKARIYIMIAFLAATSVTLCAQEEIAKKLDALKDSLRLQLSDAPRLNIVQKTAIFSIVKIHRDKIRACVEALRVEIIEGRREFRNSLTREQLLDLLELRDEFSMRPPAMKAACFMKKLEPSQRVEMLKLIRLFWRGGKTEMDYNLEQLLDFHRNVLFSSFAEKLSLTPKQRSELGKILDNRRAKVKELTMRLLNEVFSARDRIRMVLSAEQITFIEENRDQVFRKILEFTVGL